jgi:hypothetical protein
MKERFSIKDYFLNLFKKRNEGFVYRLEAEEIPSDNKEDGVVLPEKQVTESETASDEREDLNDSSMFENGVMQNVKDDFSKVLQEKKVNLDYVIRVMTDECGDMYCDDNYEFEYEYPTYEYFLLECKLDTIMRMCHNWDLWDIGQMKCVQLTGDYAGDVYDFDVFYDPDAKINFKIEDDYESINVHDVSSIGSQDYILDSKEKILKLLGEEFHYVTSDNVTIGDLAKVCQQENERAKNIAFQNALEKQKQQLDEKRRKEVLFRKQLEDEKAQVADVFDFVSDK